ncbi:sensor histidine kinase [Natrinema caseinilyticum]|uniref:sensor histidine kinase n=1 Tax=Natrinema caseinilyticum TaxID=2961570 RepID=UPI0020C4C1F7|nr:HAMP domain-containing sensor histidine kinase [Natrinema caseinilyticum]
MSEKARAFERAIESTARSPDSFSARDVLTTIATDLEAETGGRVDVSVPADLSIRSNRELFELAFANLIENGLTHNDAENPCVTVDLERTTDDRSAVFTVHDNGPGIPDHELAVLERGEETALEHGSGIGLWIVSWSVAALGGDLEFDTAAGGTSVTVRCSAVVEPESPAMA